MKIINFHSNRPYNSFNEYGQPQPVKNNIPEWFMKSDRFWRNENGEVLSGYDGSEALSFKNCPALLDIFISGYVLKTPCDISFTRQNGQVLLDIDSNYMDFCGSRDEMPNFQTPYGYDEKHFHWYPNWGIGLPKGYSALYTSPINRFDLPFLTVAGVIDSDKMDTPGLVPFFLHKDFSGTIKAGTPYMQIFPFKREDWEMNNVYYSYEEIIARHEKQASTFRIPGGGAYKRLFWQKKRYS
jgi:hypothetical protein